MHDSTAPPPVPPVPIVGDRVATVELLTRIGFTQTEASAGHVFAARFYEGRELVTMDAARIRVVIDCTTGELQLLGFDVPIPDARVAAWTARFDALAPLRLVEAALTAELRPGGAE